MAGTAAHASSVADLKPPAVSGIVSTTTEVIIDALTRSTVQRDRVGLAATDAQLLRKLCGERDPRRLEYLAAISRLLRLLDGLLSGRETGEGLVEKYFVQLRDLRKRFADIMGREAQVLDAFDEAAQLFSPDARSQVHVAALIGLDELRGRARDTYQLLKRWWESALERGT
jgi:hypothetical protein